MTALYVADDPATPALPDLANLYGLGAPTQPPLKFGLFFFDYDLDGRHDLLSANGHLESEIDKIQASETYRQSAQLFWNTGKPGRALFPLVGPDIAGPDLFSPDRRPRQRLRRHRRRRRPRRGHDLQRRPRPPLPQRRRQQEPLAPPPPDRAAPPTPTASAPRSRSKAGGHLTTSPALPRQGYLSSVELPMTFGLGAADRVDEFTILWPSGKKAEFKGLAAGRLYRIDETRGLQ